MNSATLRKTTPLDSFPAFLTWCKASPLDKPGIARQQLIDGVVKELQAQCRDGEHWIVSEDCTLGEMGALVEWSQQMGGDNPLSGLFRQVFRQEGE